MYVGACLWYRSVLLLFSFVVLMVDERSEQEAKKCLTAVVAVRFEVSNLEAKHCM